MYIENIMGMANSIEHAISTGCVGSHKCRGKVAVVFDARRVVSKRLAPKFIQVMLEQVGSGWIPTNHTRTSNRIEKYYVRLQRATKVWYFSHFAMDKMLQRAPYLSTKAVYVPTRAYMAGTKYNCTNAVLPCMSMSVVLYKHGMLHTCRYQCALQTWQPTGAAGYVQSHSCSLLSGDVHVLLFGTTGNSNRWREKLCDNLYGAVRGSLCLHSAWGQALNYFVCKATLVVVERYFTWSALETHRIDRLLQAKKFVLSTPSADARLDNEYSAFVFFTQRNSAVSYIQWLLQTPARIDAMRAAAHVEFMKSVAAARSQLCLALTNFTNS